MLCYASSSLSAVPAEPFLHALRASGLDDEPAAGGFRLGQYRLLGLLGSGGMGQVFKAEHLLMKRLVALKAIAAALLQEDGAVARFHHEIQVAARLQHPNIVTAYDAAEAQGVHFLVMEYVEGVDLGRLVGEHGPLPVALACEYIRQAALGLQHAHDCGLVHCDIKPANLLVRWPAPGEALAPQVKILDFGLARLAGSASPRLTGAAVPDAEGSLAGTPDYMAPEQARAGHTVDIRSDLYSLGCTFYFLLTGQVPFPETTCAAKLLGHQFDQPLPIVELRPEAPAAVAGIVGRLMAKDPAERYTIPAELAAALQAWLAVQSNPLDASVVAISFAAGKTQVVADGLTLPSTDINLQPNGDPASPSGLEACDARPPVARNSFDFDSGHSVVSAPARPARRIPGPFALGSAIALGFVIALLARPDASPPAAALAASPSPSTALAGPFRLGHRPDRSFASLVDAIAAAEDGDTVSIEGDGPFPMRPLAVRSKALKLLAAPGYRPCLRLVRSERDPSWQPLLSTDRPLTIEGLDLVGASPESMAGPADTMHLVYTERAPLCLVNCTLAAPRGRALVVCRGAKAVDLHHCRVAGHSSLVCVEVGRGAASQVRLTDCTLATEEERGTALSLWPVRGAEPAAAHLVLQRSHIQAGRVLALTDGFTALETALRDNTLTFREAVLSITSGRTAEDWRQAVRWHGQDNHYQGSADWLQVNGAPAGVASLSTWREFWQAAEAGSMGVPSSPLQAALAQQPD